MIFILIGFISILSFQLGYILGNKSKKKQDDRPFIEKGEK